MGPLKSSMDVKLGKKGRMSSILKGHSSNRAMAVAVSLFYGLPEGRRSTYLNDILQNHQPESLLVIIVRDIVGDLLGHIQLLFHIVVVNGQGHLHSLIIHLLSTVEEDACVILLLLKTDTKSVFLIVAVLVVLALVEVLDQFLIVILIIKGLA